MRFVFKAVFWFTLVLLLLPEEALHRPSGNNQPATDVELLTSTVGHQDALARITRICADQPDLCRQTAKALSTIDIDTEAGARMALAMLLAAAKETRLTPTQ